MSRVFNAYLVLTNNNICKRLSLKDTYVKSDLFSQTFQAIQKKVKSLDSELHLSPILLLPSSEVASHYQQFSGYQSKIISMQLQNSLYVIIVKILSHIILLYSHERQVYLGVCYETDEGGLVQSLIAGYQLSII